jgi:hypothetical protein
MQIDFNHVRILAGQAYNSLVEKLEKLPESEKENLENDMDNLKLYLASICFSYNDNDPDFIDLYGKIKLKPFNEKEDD